jgi:hypothetical protein
VAETLAAIDGPEVRGHGGFALPGTGAETARKGLRQLMAHFTRAERQAQLYEAERAWVENPTKENEARWHQLKEADTRAECEAFEDEIASLGGAPQTG